MSLITWSDNYSVKVSTIDNQHKKLVEIINNLHDAMKTGKGKEAIGKTLNELVSYTKYHFSAEEEMMKKHNYPGFIAHKREHDLLTQKVVDFENDFRAGKSLLTLEVMNFLKKWLVDHILNTDKQYVPTLASNGIK